MTRPTALTATSSADFLAALPRLTGLKVPDSCYVVMFDGKRTIGAARIDLPKQQHQGDLQFLMAWVKQVLTLAEHGDAAAIVLETTDRVGDSHERTNIRGLALVLRHAASTHKVVLRDVLAVGADGWAAFIPEDQPALCPLDEITQSPLHDPDLVTLPLTEWRAAHPGQTADDAEDITQLASRMMQEQQESLYATRSCEQARDETRIGV